MREITADRAALREGVKTYLDAFPGDTICVRQVWYQGLGGQGVPTEADMAAMHAVMEDLPDWADVGVQRHEIFGQQRMFRKNRPADGEKDGRIMVHHLFKVGGRYRAPDGTVYQIVLSEVYNLRCFVVEDGNLTGAMVRIDPRSDLAKSLVAVE